MFVKIKILIAVLSVESGFRFLTDNLASAAAAVEAFFTALADIYKVHILPPPKILDPPDFVKSSDLGHDRRGAGNIQSLPSLDESKHQPVSQPHKVHAVARQSQLRTE